MDRFSLLLILLLQICDTVRAGVINAETISDDSYFNDSGIAECRQQCFKKCQILKESGQKTLNYISVETNAINTDPLSDCRQNWNCLMCHDYCRALRVAKRDLAVAMCRDQKFCALGCRTACNFNRIYTLDTLIYQIISNA